MAKIDELIFGSIVVEGKKYRRDILLFADGTVKKREGGFLMFGSHKIKKQELEELSQGQPEIIIVGTGTNGAAHIAPEAESWAKGKNLSLLVQPSYDAVTRLNELVEQKKGCCLDAHNLLRHKFYVNLVLYVMCSVVLPVFSFTWINK